jgi:hypothetical protein
VIAVKYESINRHRDLRIKNRQFAPNASKQNSGSSQILFVEGLLVQRSNPRLGEQRSQA